MTLNQLIASLKSRGVLRSAEIERALKYVDRAKFVPDEYSVSAYDDTPLPIGQRQTISQPYTVVFMLELLGPKRGERIMDVGSGSGWQAALLAELIGARGKVYTIEIMPELCAILRRNIARFPKLAPRIKCYCQSAYGGLSDIARDIGGFDAIIAAAEVRDVPLAWRQQLKVGGRLVYPKANSLFLEVKQEDGTFGVDEYPGFAFVPFVKEGEA